MSEIVSRQVPLVWVGLEELPIQFASSLVVQLSGPNELVVTIGQAAPPMTTGTPEQQVEQLNRVQFIQGRPLVRLSVTPERAADFIRVLQEGLDNHARIIAGGGQR